MEKPDVDPVWVGIMQCLILVSGDCFVSATHSRSKSELQFNGMPLYGKMNARPLENTYKGGNPSIKDEERWAVQWCTDSSNSVVITESCFLLINALQSHRASRSVCIYVFLAHVSEFHQIRGQCLLNMMSKLIKRTTNANVDIYCKI